MHLAGHHEPDMVVLAERRADDGTHVLRPAPAGLEDLSEVQLRALLKSLEG
jgi:hypothetical protein